MTYKPGHGAVSLLRYITHPAGVTAAELVKATGKERWEIRAHLSELEYCGKVERKRAPVGKPHLWWRAGKKPSISGIDAVVSAELAAVMHSPGKLRSVLDRLAAKSANPAHRAVFAMVRKSADPKKVLLLALEELERDRLECEEVNQ